MAQSRIFAANATVVPISRGRVSQVEVSAEVPIPVSRGRVTSVEAAALAPVALPLPVVTVDITSGVNGHRVRGVASAAGADEWAWSVDGSAVIDGDDSILDLILPATQEDVTRSLFVRYRAGEDWSGATSANFTTPQWRSWVGFNGQLVPYTPRRGGGQPGGDSARGRVAQVEVTATSPVTDPDPDTLTPATGTPSTGLFFELPTAEQVNPERKILAHYFGPQPGAFSNAATDYYETGYLPVNGEGGAHAAYGGLMRDRPMLGAPFSTSPSWERNMQKAEINAAKQAGLNGFFCNIMGSSGANWDRYVWMADEASANHPGFLVVPMVDANGNMAQNEAASVAAARINTMLSKSCAWRLSDGRYVVGTFKMEGRPLSYWNEVKTLLTSTYGKNTAWIGVYNNLNMAANYTGLQWSSGMWGPGADPNIYANLSNYGSAIKSRGEKYLLPVWAQDVRPRSDLFDEARNSEALRAGLDAAIRQNADIIQLCTWSDHTEGSQVRPTVKQGQAKLDVAAYGITKWKTGKYPRILRDAVYVSYRNQMFNASITGGQTRFMSHWARTNRSALRESVEVLTYFTSPADVTVKVGTKTYTYTAPAGEFQYLAPLSPGEVSVKAVRSSAEIARINCPIVVKSTTVNQDREYVWFSSLRGTQGQYDPTPGSPAPNPQNFLP